VEAAQAQARIAGAARLPTLDAGLSASRSQRLLGSEFAKIRTNQFGLDLNLNWEIDLWGRLVNERRSAVNEFRASEADYQAARLSLAANVIRTAFTLLEAEKQAELAQKNLKSLRINLEILDADLEAGNSDDNSALEITLSKADVLRA